MKDNPKSQSATEDSRLVGKKKSYRRPEILYREPLEAMAALCTPPALTKGSVGLCPTAQKS